MTQDSAIAACEKRGLRVGMFGRDRADEIDPAMESDEPAVSQPGFNLHLGHAGRQELLAMDDAILPRSK